MQLIRPEVLPNESFQSQLTRYDALLAIEREAKKTEHEKYDCGPSFRPEGVASGPSVEMTPEPDMDKRSKDCYNHLFIFNDIIFIYLASSKDNAIVGDTDQDSLLALIERTTG